MSTMSRDHTPTTWTGATTKRYSPPTGILAIDETGFLKRGTESAGVACQYSGNAGRVENCQVGVFFSYAFPAGRTFLDRELYLPKVWIDDAERCTRAGIPKDRVMATKPVLAAEMIERALDAGIEAEWTTGDAVYGQHTGLRRHLEADGMLYVMAVPMNQHAITPTRAHSASKGGPTNSSPPWTGGPGAPAPLAPGPKANGSTPGPGSASTDLPRQGNTGCCPAAP